MTISLNATAFASGSGGTITRPAEGSTVSGMVPVTLADAPRPGFSNFYIDGNLVVSAAPANLSWNSATVGNGSHVLAVKSFSSAGRFLGGQAVTVSVQNLSPAALASPSGTPTPTAAPTPTPTLAPSPAPTTAAVIITAPGNNTFVAGTITFSAIKSASCEWMNFYVDGNYVSSSPPSSILWDSTSVGDGMHTLSVMGFDSSSNLIANPAITVTVDNVSGVPRTPVASTTPAPTATPTQALPTATPTKALPTTTATPSASSTPISDPLRPSNDIPNNRMPTAAELTAFQQGVGSCGGLDTCTYMQSVTGQYVGTTQEIIQQVADKWCPSCTIVNPYDGLTYSFGQLMMAVAVNETNWNEWKSASLATPDPITGLTTLTPSHGDLEHVTATQPDGGSWGLFQIAEGVGQGWPASFPLSAESTGFNADFKTAEQMGVEQGHLDYLADPSRSAIAVADGYPPYVNYTDSDGVLHPASTDVNVLRWGAVGNWYSGGWYDTGAITYIEQVQQILHNQPWTQSGF
jgi:Big-like domain-containing protein